MRLRQKIRFTCRPRWRDQSTNEGSYALLSIVFASRDCGADIPLFDAFIEKKTQKLCAQEDPVDMSALCYRRSETPAYQSSGEGTMDTEGGKSPET